MHYIQEHAQIQCGRDSLFTTHYPNEDKPALVLLHGGPGAPEEFEWFVELLHDKFDIITFHQRGTVKSPCPSGSYSIKAYLDDLNAVTQYYGVDKFHLIGHSWGGLYAQLYATEYSDRLLSLLLVSPGTGTGQQWQEMEVAMMAYNKAHCSPFEWLKMGLYQLAGSLGISRAGKALYRQVERNYNADYPEFRELESDTSNATVIAGNKTVEVLRSTPLMPDGQEFEFPMTITFGDNDIFGETIRFVKVRYPKAHYVTVPHSGHTPFVHNPTRFAQIVNHHFTLTT